MNVVERIAIGDDVRLAFHCQGCKCGHAFRIQGPQPVWDWNGSMERPTFAPSLLYRMHDPATGQQLSCCHSFVRDGQIEYLGDCTHHLANKTIPLEVIA